jgi:hypothetical protein
MTALKIARASLAASILFYAAVLGLGYAALLAPDAGMLLAIAAIVGTAISAMACLIIALLRRGGR